jgi:hypothetical protein
MSEQPKGFVLDDKTKTYIKYGAAALVVLIVVVVFFLVILPKINSKTGTSAAAGPAKSASSAQAGGTSGSGSGINNKGQSGATGSGLLGGGNSPGGNLSTTGPLYYITQVFNQTSPISTTAGLNQNTTFFARQGIPPNWKKSIVTYGGPCLIDLSFTAYNSASNQGINFALTIDGVVQQPFIFYYFNRANDHKTIPASFTFQDIPAGVHTIGLYVSYGGASSTIVDYNDTLTMRIIEINKSLTTGPNPQIYLTQVFNKRSPVTSNPGTPDGMFVGKGTPPNWSSTFISRGGTCVIDLCFTAFIFNDRPNQGINFALLIDGIPQTPNIFYFFNIVSDHKTIPASFTIKDISAGEHTLALYLTYGSDNNDVGVDWNDSLTMRVTEFSKSLTTGSSPKIYLTEVFNQQSPTSNKPGSTTGLIGNGILGAGIPDKWTKKKVKTYGGTCVIDLSFTAYVTASDYIHFALVIDDQVYTPPIFHAFNTIGDHRAIYSNFTIPNLAAGEHTFAIRIDLYGIGKVKVDHNDLLNMKITEFMGATINPPLPVWNGYPTGQAINCGMGDFTGGNTGGANGGGSTIYRYVGNNTANSYGTEAIARSWDANWNSPQTINCTGLTKGDNMTLKQ